MRTTIGLACLLLLTPSLTPQKQSDRATAEKYIHDSEAAWAESVASGDVSVPERILADDFVGVDPFDGSTYTKAQEISDTKEHHTEYISNHLNDVRIRFFGDNTAVAQGSESWERKAEPKKGRFVWTDTWILRNGKWQVVAAEDMVPPK